MNDNANPRVEWNTKSSEPTRQQFSEQTRWIIRHLQKAVPDIIDLNLPQRELKEMIADYLATLLEAGPDYVEYLEGKVSSQLQFEDSQRPVVDRAYTHRPERDRPSQMPSPERGPPPPDRTCIQPSERRRTLSRAPSPEQSLDTSEFLDLPPTAQGVRRPRRFRPFPAAPPAEYRRPSFDEPSLQQPAVPSTSTPVKPRDTPAPPKVTQKSETKAVKFADCCPPHLAVPSQPPPPQPKRRGDRVRRILFPEDDYDASARSFDRRPRNGSALADEMPAECTFDERPADENDINDCIDALERRNLSQQRLLKYMNDYHNYLVEKYATPCPPQRVQYYARRMEPDLRVSRIASQEPREMPPVRDTRQFDPLQPHELSDVRQRAAEPPQPRSPPHPHEAHQPRAEPEIRPSTFAPRQQPAESAEAGADEGAWECSLSRFERFLRDSLREDEEKRVAAAEQREGDESGQRFRPVRETESDSTDSAAEEEFMEAMMRIKWPYSVE